MTGSSGHRDVGQRVRQRGNLAGVAATLTLVCLLTFTPGVIGATSGPGLPPISDALPTRDSTGVSSPITALRSSGAITSSYDGQVISGMDVTGNIRIQHDDVTVRDSRVNFTSTHGLEVQRKADGSCPVGTLFEYIELNGALADESDVPLYGHGCAWTLDRAHVHDVGRAIKVVNHNVVSNSYIVSSRTGDSGSHRGAVGNNGAGTTC